MTERLIDVVSTKVLHQKYENYLSDILRIIKPYEGIALPSRSLLLEIQCESVVDPLKLSVEIISRIYNENLCNPVLRFAILCETNTDKKLIVTYLESMKISDVTNVIIIGSNTNGKKLQKTDLNKYSMVILVDQDYQGTVTRSIEILKRIDYTGPMVITNKTRLDFTDSHKADLLKETSKEDLMVLGDVESLPDLINSLRIDFYTHISSVNIDSIDKMNSQVNGIDPIANFYRTISNVHDRNILKYSQIIVLCETDEIAQFMAGTFETYTLDNTLNPKILECRTYSKDNFMEFCNLNNRFEREVFEIQLISNEIILESGIMFITLDKLINLMRSPVQMRYINMIYTLTQSGLDKNVTNLISQILEMNSTVNIDKTFIFVDIYRKRLATQLSNIYETIYHKNVDKELELISTVGSTTDDKNNKTEYQALKKLHKVNAFTELNLLISNKQISSEVNLTNQRRDQLESTYSIRKDDYDYINRYSIVYVNPITTKRNDNPMSATGMYQMESQYLYLPSPKTGKIYEFSQMNSYTKAVSDRTEELRNEVEQIINAKNDRVRLKKYSGPLWLGRENASEQEGSLVGFSNEILDTIEFAQILGTFKFTRTYKRDGWTEKENRDKKILFLSPIFRKQKLSEFRKQIKRSANQKFMIMEKIYI